MKNELTAPFKGINRKVAAFGFQALFILAVITFKQWLDGPIAIRPFTVMDDASTAGISVTTLAEQTKAHISTIYAASGDLFQTRKLGEPTIALDIRIGDTGWTFQSLTGALLNAFGKALTSADISGRIVTDGGGLSLQWTTVRAGSVFVDKFPIQSAGTSRLANVDSALACLALRVVAELSPDVAANYLQKQGETDGSKGGCIAQDVVELYSRVSKDEARPAAARVNALVGLSVHYQHSLKSFDELGMAEAATRLASSKLSCDGPNELSSRWQRLKCRLSAYRPFSDKNLRAEIAAWMQLGIAQSDYAAAAPTLKEMNARRNHAIEAYDHVIAIKGDYPPAYDAKGLQLRLLNESFEADQAYRRSLAMGENSPAHIDLALFRIRSSNETLNKQDIPPDDLSDAENHFLRAIELSPDYWYAYGALGYVLYREGKLDDAADVLAAAVEHDKSNRSLRVLLGSVYAGLCRFEAAHKSFQSAYGAYKNPNDANARNVRSDWGQVLREFGLRSAAIDEESAVLASKPDNVDALRIRGEIKIETASANPADIEAGLEDLQAAVDHDPSKSDTVLSAYLEGLVQAGRAWKAVATYETWSQLGYVPPLATTSVSDAVVLPATPNTRLAYARALLQDRQLQRASLEFAVLSGLGVPLDAQVSGELQARAGSTGTAEANLRRVSTEAGGTPALVSGVDSKHECNLPPLSRTSLPEVREPAHEPQTARARYGDDPSWS